MEVTGQNGAGQPARQRFEDLRAAITRRNALRVREAREDLSELSEHRHQVQRATRDAVTDQQVDRSRRTSEETKARSKQDRVEISQQAREAAELASRAHESDGERDARVAKLRDEQAAGRINTPERIQRAASRLLDEQG